LENELQAAIPFIWIKYNQQIFRLPKQ